MGSVIGILSCCAVHEIQALALVLIEGKKQEYWMRLTQWFQSLHVLWPALDLLVDDMDDNAELSRANSKLLIFSIHADVHMEDFWTYKLKSRRCGTRPSGQRLTPPGLRTGRKDSPRRRSGPYGEA